MARRLYTLVILLGLLNAVLAGISQKARRNTPSSRGIIKRDTDPSLLYPQYNLSVPIDHFFNDSMYEPHSNGFFNLSYWFDASFYKLGGPVIVLQGGETSGTDRLQYLQKGTIHELAAVTHGIAVVLEHRYYGTSIPTPDLSTESLRFLTTDQTLADEVYFAKNIVFPGFEHLNLTSPNAAYIGYGGSYAGGFNAFLRKLYPDVFWGAISSSGVIEAIVDYWDYFEPIREFADPTCILYNNQITNMVDNILLNLNDPATTQELKSVFGLPNLTYGNDLAQTLAYSGIYGWQNRNWDPVVNDPTFDLWCGNLTSQSILYPRTANLTSAVQDLLQKGGYGSKISTLTNPILNWIGFLAIYIAEVCSPGRAQDDCFGNHDIPSFQADDITQSWRPWSYQYCTQWGFLQPGTAPPGELPLISKTNDLAYEELVCEYAFNITTPPNVTAINKYGGFGLSYPRLAFIDGEQDPWRPAGAHANPFNTTARNRTNTINEPYVLIKGAVHHWDQNGLFLNETTPTLPPLPIKVAQAYELIFVLAWMAEWNLKHGRHEERGW